MNHEPRCSFYFLLGENSLLACIDEMTVVLKKCKEWLLSTKYKIWGKKRQKLTVKIHDVLSALRSFSNKMYNDKGVKICKKYV